jgi:hypothetical protein
MMNAHCVEETTYLQKMKVGMERKMIKLLLKKVDEFFFNLSSTNANSSNRKQIEQRGWALKVYPVVVPR